jgi:hypothetical protein
LADPMIGVPSVAMIMHPAVSYHSSLDTMEVVDPKILFRNGVIIGTFLYFLTLPEVESVKCLLDEIKIHRKRNLDGKYSINQALAYLTELAFDKGVNSLNLLLQGNNGVFLNTMRSTLESLGGGEALHSIDIKSKELINTARSVIPLRKVKGALTLHTLKKELRESIKWDPFYDYHANCSLFWTDGKRNLYEIFCLYSTELNIEISDKSLSNLLEHYYMLEEIGYFQFLNG